MKESNYWKTKWNMLNTVLNLKNKKYINIKNLIYNYVVLNIKN